jgi:ATP-dependent Clp protease adaptor protein ClpS
MAPAAPDVDERTDTDEAVDEDTLWDVIVWDDPVNLMAYVVHVFRKVLRVDEHVAHRLMMEVHTEGQSLVATEPRETAEKYVAKFHAHGLQATMRAAT